MAQNDYYSKLGLKTIINAVGNQTVYGGSTPVGTVKEAMESSESNYILISPLYFLI